MADDCTTRPSATNCVASLGSCFSATARAHDSGFCNQRDRVLRGMPYSHEKNLPEMCICRCAPFESATSKSKNSAQNSSYHASRRSMLYRCAKWRTPAAIRKLPKLPARPLRIARLSGMLIPKTVAVVNNHGAV
jgi:hypothetical protein